MHHMTLKAAVEKYGSLKKEGKSEQEIIEAIKADDKKFSDEEVLEIYSAIKGEETLGTGGEGANNGNTPDAGKQGENSGTSEDAKPKKHFVKQEFRDIANFNTVHSVGSDVSHFDEKRLAGLVEKGLVEIK